MQVFDDCFQAESGWNCPKHVEFYNRINIWIISASGWLFKKKYITMHDNKNVK